MEADELICGLRLKHQRGIFMLGTVVAVIFIVMLMMGILNLVVWYDIQHTGWFYNRESARQIAETGLDYAKSRLEQNRNWQGNGTDQVLGSLKVDEYYNSKKALRGSFGNKQHFYITFESAPDICKHTSYNNIIPAGSQQVESGSIYNIWDAGTGSSTKGVPAESALIIVKGVCGSSVVHLVGLFGATGYGGVNSAAIAYDQMNYNMSAGTGQLFYLDAVNLITPKMCSNYPSLVATDPSIKVTVGKVDLSGGEAITKGDYSSFPDPADINGSIRTGTETTIPPLDLATIKEKLLQRGISEISLRAGTYTFTAPDTLVYSNGVTTKTYTKDPIDGTPVSGTERLEGLKLDGFKLEVEQPQKVMESGGKRELKIWAAGNLIRRIKIILKDDSYIMNDNFIANPPEDGRIFVKGEVSGYGSVYASGDIVFQGKSILNATPDQGVALFSENDITMESIDKQNPSGQPITDQDVVMSNFDVSDPDSRIRRLADEFTSLCDVRLTGGMRSWNYTHLASDILPRSDFRNERRNITYAFRNDSLFQSPYDPKELNLFMVWLSQYESAWTDIDQYDSLFWGLIYANKNFRYNGSNSSFSLIGTLIAAHGKIEISDTKKVSLLFDPDYLGVFSDYNYFQTCTLRRLFYYQL